MLKKLTALSLSLLICLSLLPCQAGAMDAPEDEHSIQAEDMENLGPTEGGAAPCTVVAWAEDGSGGRGGGGGKNLPINVPIRAGNGRDYGSNP